MSKKNIILIIFDTLRADFVSSYNQNSIVQTPTIDKIAKNGVKLGNAYSTAPETASAHASIFTGLYPHNHGIACDTPQPPLETNIPTIASWLSDRGYTTFGIAGPSKMDSDYNYDQGFDDYYEHYKTGNEKLTSIGGIKRLLTDKSYRERKSNDILAGSDNGARKKFDLLKKVVQNSQDPYFIMANFIECHSSYSAPRAYTEETDSDFNRPKYAFLERFNLGSRSHSDPDIQLEKLTNYRETINRQYSDSDYLSEKELETWEKWYAAELRYLDDQLGAFIDHLKRTNELDDTLLIFTSDHGELFGEHDLVYHNNFLWDKLLNVPLIIYADNLPSDTQNKMFSIVDLFPTVCDLVDIDKPENINGKSLFSETDREFGFAEIGERDISVINRDWYLNPEQKEKFDRGKKAVWDQQLKYIKYSDGTENAYTIPNEKEASGKESHISQLREELRETLGENHPTPPENEHQVSESTLKNLEELGYR